MIIQLCYQTQKSTHYHLASLNELYSYKKFLVNEEFDCSYSQFARYVSWNIIKPKPEDWVSCLCMICLNSVLKLEAVITSKLYRVFHNY